MTLSPQQKEKYKETGKKYLATKRGHVMKYLCKAKDRVKGKNIPFDIDLEYLLSIATDECPVFKTPFVWGRYNGDRHDMTPSLDRIIPELGYVKGNVVFISDIANRIKSNATEKELYAVADWLHEARKNVIKKQPTSISERTDSQSEHDAKRRALFAARAREDRDDTHHHCGADARKDADHSTQASSGDGVGTRNQEVEPSVTLTRIENHGESEAEIIRLDFSRRHLSD